MKTKQLFLGAMVAAAVTFMFSACQKNQSAETVTAGKQSMNLYLTDGPGFFDKVLIDIKSVQVLVDTSNNTRRHDTCDWDRIGAYRGGKDSSLVWESLSVAAGVYDVLGLRNGIDTLLASAMIPKGAIRLLRIEIGTNNSVVKDSVSYPISIPATANNYILIKLKGNEPDEFLPGKIRLWIDFDINRSIFQDRNNHFILIPFFKFFVTKSTASVAGKVGPQDAKAVLTLYNATDTAYALPDRSGQYRLRGLKDGTYSLYVNASNGYADTTITNITVTAPKETTIPAITLHK